MGNNSSRWRPLLSPNTDLQVQPHTDVQILQDEIARMQEECIRIIPKRKFRIVMCACSNNGKSSSINNILSALKCDNSRTVNDGEGERHITERYSEYMMLIGNSTKSPFVICDSPGFIEESNDHIEGLQTEVMKSIIMGKFKSGEKVNYKTMTLEDLAKKDTKQDCAVCVFFVIDVRRVNMEMKQSAAFKSMKNILEFVQRNDIKAAFLLTKCDEFNFKVKKDPKHIYKSKSIEEKIRIVSGQFKFSINRIFPIVNDTEQIWTDNDRMKQSLIALRQVMGDISSNLTRRVDVPADINLQ